MELTVTGLDQGIQPTLTLVGSWPDTITAMAWTRHTSSGSASISTDDTITTLADSWCPMGILVSWHVDVDLTGGGTDHVEVEGTWLTGGRTLLTPLLRPHAGQWVDVLPSSVEISYESRSRVLQALDGSTTADLAPLLFPVAELLALSEDSTAAATLAAELNDGDGLFIRSQCAWILPTGWAVMQGMTRRPWVAEPDASSPVEWGLTMQYMAEPLAMDLTATPRPAYWDLWLLGEAYSWLYATGLTYAALRDSSVDQITALGIPLAGSTQPTRRGWPS